MKIPTLSTLLACLVLPSLAAAAGLHWSETGQRVDTVLRFAKGPDQSGEISETLSVGNHQFSAPDFCHGLDCPDYKVLQNETTFELREYVATQWVSTSLKGVQFQDAERKMFFRLFDYISGKNNESKKIAMTAPVLTRIIPGQGPACENDFIMSFFVSPNGGQPPAPSDPTVELTARPSARVYVRSFGGFATEDVVVKEAEQLAQDLGSVPYEMTYYFTAGYDSPFKFFGRHNEIWFLAK